MNIVEKILNNSSDTLVLEGSDLDELLAVYRKLKQQSIRDAIKMLKEEK